MGEQLAKKQKTSNNNKGVTFLREIFSYILQIKHENAVNEMLPIWRKEHQFITKSIGLQKRISHVTFGISQIIDKYKKKCKNAGIKAKLDWQFIHRNDDPESKFRICSKTLQGRSDEILWLLDN